MFIKLRVIVIMLSLIFSMAAKAGTIAFPDPSGKDLARKYLSLDEKSVRSMNVTNNSVDQFILGNLYLKGNNRLNITRSKNKSLNFLTKSWEAGVVDSGFALALLKLNYDKNAGGIEKFKELIMSTAKENYIRSQRVLAIAFGGGELTDIFGKNNGKSIYWYKRAANNGDQFSAAKVSYLYKQGSIVDKDAKKAFYWREIASEARYGGARLSDFRVLAEYYEEGYGVEKNYKQAYKYYDMGGTPGIKGKERLEKVMPQKDIDEAIAESRKWQEDNNIYVPSYNGLHHQSDGSYR